MVIVVERQQLPAGIGDFEERIDWGIEPAGVYLRHERIVGLALNLEDAHQAMSMLNTIEARYTPQMPRGKWLEQMHDELNRARDSAGNMQLI